MKVACIDLNYPDHFEDYSYMPKKYGGGRIVAGAMMEHDSDFFIFADERSFANVRPETRNQCVVLDWEKRQAIRTGQPVKAIIPNADDFDLFFTCATNIVLNLEGCRSRKSAVWSIGWGETIDPRNKNIILFDQKHQEARMSDGHNVYHVVIGPKVEPFEENLKEDIIFQCTRHTACFQSVQVASLALKHKIKTIFAGPIERGYPLMDYIDDKTTYYLGEISQEEKIAYNKLAKFHTQFQNYPTCATLSAKEALSYGTPVMAMPIGGWPEFIRQGKNGFIIRTEQDFLDAWNKRDEIKQRDCWESVLYHSENNMIASFRRAFDKIWTS